MCPQACNAGTLPTIAILKQALLDNDYVQQPDAYLSQANPVSGTWYTVLATTANVRVRTISANVTWAVTQPTPMRVRITIDGNTPIYSITNPVSTTNYSGYVSSPFAEAFQALSAADNAAGRSFLCEGKSVLVEVNIDWVVTQPTPLTCRVKYARRV